MGRDATTGTLDLVLRGLGGILETASNDALRTHAAEKSRHPAGGRRFVMLRKPGRSVANESWAGGVASDLRGGGPSRGR
jgi:hypothetical protein